jgi:DNA-binding SARP family transcriptional activator
LQAHRDAASPVLAERSSGLTLPFMLSGERPGDTIDVPAIAVRVDAIYDLVQTTRLELRAQLTELRRINLQVLDAVSTAADGSSSSAGPAGQAAGSDEQPVLTFRLLGGFTVHAGDRLIDGWTSKKARQLLAFLAMAPDHATGRETLVEMFWPGASPARGSNNLSIAVHHIRSRLGELVAGSKRGVLVRQATYRLDPNLHCWVDVREFDSRIAEARASLRGSEADAARRLLEQAVELYAGDFMASDLLEEWTAEPRRAFADAYEWAISWLATDAAAGGAWDKVLHLGQAMLRRDPINEDGHRWIIRAHGEMGNRTQALRQYRMCEELLRDELGVTPAAETRELLRRVTGIAP